MRDEHERLADVSSNEPLAVEQTELSELPRDSGNELADPLLRFGFQEPSFLAGLFESLRDAVFPARLPALELTSAPIALPDRMGGGTNPWAIGTAALMNAGVLALLILLGLRTTLGHPPLLPPGSEIRLKDFKLIAPSLAHGGGGGGTQGLVDPMTGRLPRQEEIPLVPLQVPLLQKPLLAVDQAIAVPPDVKLPDHPLLPNIGAHNSPNVRLLTDSAGKRGGIDGGSNLGDGPGDGTGHGPGSDRGSGDGVYTPGVGGVSRPVLVVSHDAEFSDEARRHKYEGVCLISIVVDARGYPQNPRVTRALGMGLDEKALEAVKQYRFKPAMKDGKPVASMMSVEINFHLY